MVEAIYIFKRDKESTLKIISKYTRITDPESLDRTYQALTKYCRRRRCLRPRELRVILTIRFDPP